MEGSDKYSMVNPYTNIYQSLNIEINELTTREESEEIVRHLGLLYNTMGLVMKDFVHILKQKFKDSGEEAMRDEKQEKEVKAWKDEMEIVEPVVLPSHENEILIQVGNQRKPIMEQYPLKNPAYGLSEQSKENQQNYQSPNPPKVLEPSEIEAEPIEAEPIKPPQLEEPNQAVTINLINSKEQQVIELDDSDEGHH